jgi:hypothetical protein
MGEEQFFPVLNSSSICEVCGNGLFGSWEERKQNLTTKILFINFFGGEDCVTLLMARVI